jgi:hypothetical protein
MLRQGRVVVPNWPQRIIQLGHNKQVVFRSDADALRQRAGLAKRDAVGRAVSVESDRDGGLLAGLWAVRRAQSRPGADGEAAGAVSPLQLSSEGGAERVDLAGSRSVLRGMRADSPRASGALSAVGAGSDPGGRMGADSAGHPAGPAHRWGALHARGSEVSRTADRVSGARPAQERSTIHLSRFFPHAFTSPPHLTNQAGFVTA